MGAGDKLLNHVRGSAFWQSEVGSQFHDEAPGPSFVVFDNLAGPKRAGQPARVFPGMLQNGCAKRAHIGCHPGTVSHARGHGPSAGSHGCQNEHDHCGGEELQQ